MGNLSYQTTKEDLTQVLSEAGQVVDVYIPTDRESGRPRGFAFATFSSEAEAAKAIQLFNQREVAGRRLNVNAAEERPRRPAGGGGFAGGGGGGGYGGRPGGGAPGGRPGGGFGGGGGGYGARNYGPPPAPPEPDFGFEGGRYTRDDDAGGGGGGAGGGGGGGGGGGPPGGGKKFKSKGSRRGLRARKRSL